MTLTRRFKAYRKRLHRLWLLLTLIALLGSFGTMAGCYKAVVKVDPCTGWEPIYVSGVDVLSDATAKSIYAHDLHGVSQGCWKAPKKKGP